MVAVRWWEDDPKLQVSPRWEIREQCVWCEDPAQEVCVFCEKWVCDRHLKLAVYYCWQGPLWEREKKYEEAVGKR